MTKANRVRLYLLDTGYCLAWEHHVMRGATHRRIACHALVGLIEHPSQGWLLWDTGYAPRMLAETQAWPFRLYRAATPLRIAPHLAVIEQLPAFGIGPESIRHIIISHFHADHVAGLCDFPHARFVASREAYEAIQARRGMSALRRGIIPTLIPHDFSARATLLPPFTGPALPALGSTHDLFGDQSLQLVALPGHARGQLGMLANTERGPVLLAADGAWHRRAIREQRPPHPMTRLLVDDMAAVQTTLQRLQAFSLAAPDTPIVPTHCPEVYAEWFGGGDRGDRVTS